MTGASIRRARPDEADLLSALARRSKAYWGYDADFLARAAAELTITPSAVAEHEVWVLVDDRGAVIGFYRLILGEPAVLEDLWLAPEVIGSGRGRRLWTHATALARAAGASAMELDAEPNAVGFYEHMSAVQIGVTHSPIQPGRVLPRMRLRLGQ